MTNAIKKAIKMFPSWGNFLRQPIYSKTGKQGGFLPGSPVTLPVAWPPGTAVLSTVGQKPEKYLNVPRKILNIIIDYLSEKTFI